MEIPKTIELAGITITTKNSSIMINGERKAGCAMYDLQEIVLDSKSLEKDTLNQTYIHELLHYILFILGYKDLNKDEQFVDSVAHLLYQSIKTSKLGEIESKHPVEE